MNPILQQNAWTSLEIAKLIVQCLTPIPVALMGIFLSRIAKKYEYYQWRNQRLVDKRIEVYDDIAPTINDLLCYFTFVGGWKEFTPPQIVAFKRILDKKVYLASPLFSAVFHQACMDYMNLCYDTFQGWGLDAKLRTPIERRISAMGRGWKREWKKCFSDKTSDTATIRSAYTKLMAVFSSDIGISAKADAVRLGSYPINIIPNRAIPEKPEKKKKIVNRDLEYIRQRNEHNKSLELTP